MASVVARHDHTGCHHHQRQDHEAGKSRSVTMGWMPPGFYDFLVYVVTFGQEQNLRREYLDLANIQSGEHVLDVGCGTGVCAMILVEGYVGPTGEVVGIDPTLSFIKKAQRRAQNSKKMGGGGGGGGGCLLRFEEGSGESLPSSLQDNSFDTVLSSFAFHHLPGDELQIKVLNEMLRVLKPGGKLLIVDFPTCHHHHHHRHHHHHNIFQSCCGGNPNDVDDGDTIVETVQKEDPLYQCILKVGFVQLQVQKVKMMDAVAFTARKQESR